MKDFIEFVTRQLVDHPEHISVSEERREGKTTYRLSVDSSDLGKVIGKKGRIAFAMRILINAIGKRTGADASFEILDGQEKRDGELVEKQ
jgi:predicted RNA-binding protein YlqC (UPF0109 family)